MAAIILDQPWDGAAFTPPTPTDIAAVEASIVARLRAQIASVEVAHFPDRPEAYRLTSRVGAALVRYEGGEYGPLIDAAAIVQERTFKFAVTVMVRDLGWGMGSAPDGATPGAYALLEAIRVALTGYAVPGCTRLYPLRESFVGRDRQGGVWTYRILFATRAMAVEAASAVNFPLLAQASAFDHGGVTNVNRGAALYAFNAANQIQLPNINVTQATITDSSGAIAYAAGADYTLDSATGMITRVATGAIAPGAAVSIAYSYAEAVLAVAGGGSAPTAPSN
jgi:hypothetical protein